MPAWYIGAAVAVSMFYNSQQGTSTTSYEASDPEAARRLAAVAEAQMAMSQEAWEVYKTDFLPYEQEMIQANIDLIDPNRELMTAQIEAEAALTPARQAATKAALDEMVSDIEAGRPVKAEMLKQQLAQLEAEGRLLSDRENLAKVGLQEALADIEAGRPLKAEMLKQNLAQLQAEGRLLPAREEVAAAGLKQQAKEMELSGPAAEKFYEEAVRGVDPEARRGEAAADVEQTYGQALKEARRDLARAGVAPGSKKYQEMMADMIYKKAKASGGAQTRATREAEEESFMRLGAAMSVRGRPGGVGALPTTHGLTPPGGYAASGAMAGATGVGLAGTESMGKYAPGATPYQPGALPTYRTETGQMAAGTMAGAGATSAAGLRPQKETTDYEKTEYGVKVGGNIAF